MIRCPAGEVATTNGSIMTHQWLGHEGESEQPAQQVFQRPFSPAMSA